jgi:hypothetical protein
VGSRRHQARLLLDQLRNLRDHALGDGFMISSVIRWAVVMAAAFEPPL